MDRNVINNIKCLAIDMINKAGSGHPGIALDAAPIIYTLFAKHLNVNINDPRWINRDRFIMSSGHGSSLLYATLFMAGYDISLDDLKNFRHIGKTPGHPEYGVTPGVEVTTGPLGEGFATAVGIALAGKMADKKYALPKKSMFDKEKNIFNYKTYVLCGDGDIMEGITSEAASLAGTWRLNNLIVLYDSNHVTLDGDTKGVMDENVLKKFEAMGWYTDEVNDGNDVDEIDKAIEKARGSYQPAIIQIHTIIGNGLSTANTSEAHGCKLEATEIEQLKTKLNVPFDPFFVNNEAMQYFRKQITDRSSINYQEWANNYREYTSTHQDDTSMNFMFGRAPEFKLPDSISLPDKDMKESLLVTNAHIMEKIANDYNNFIGGSADVVTSTRTYLRDMGDIMYPDYKGANIHFGVRENAMGAIVNGLALCSYRPFASAFLAFSDYMKPSIRMTALMNLPVTYIFTHDSINIGEDGPTHEPVEQLASLRAIPNMNVYRPADSKELLGSWKSIMASKKPSSIVLPRTEIQTIAGSDVDKTCLGGYVIEKEYSTIHAIVIATGTEVHTAINLAHELYKTYKLDLRVVSMPSREIFKNQPDAYKEEVLPKGYRKIVIEAGSASGWGEFVYNDSYLITVDSFGVSGSKNEVLKHMQFSYEDIKARIEKLLLK